MIGAYRLRGVRGIAVDQATGAVYVTDAWPNAGAVAVFTAKGNFSGVIGIGTLTFFGEELEFCSSQSSCNEPSFFVHGQGGAFGPSTSTSPGIGGIAVDPSGNIYVADEGYARVQVLRPIVSGGLVTGIEFVRAFGWGVRDGGNELQVCEVASECLPGLSGNEPGQFGENSPADIAVDSEGNVYALDVANGRIQKLTSSGAFLDDFGAAALEAIFGAGTTLKNVAIDPSEEPNHLLVSGTRPAAGNSLAVAELDSTGANVLGGGAAHGEDLTITDSMGLAAAGTQLGGGIYISAEVPNVVRGALVLNEPPKMESVEDITGTTATFKGSVVSNELPVSYHFEYSPDGKVWTSVPVKNEAAGAQPGTITVEQQVSGLTGSQNYQVRLAQEREVDGAATSQSVGFETLPAQPAVFPPAVSAITDHSATFSARLDPQNEATTYHFEYGREPCASGGCTSLPGIVAEGSGLRQVSQSAVGLSPETVYHVRLVATNPNGTSSSQERNFETLAPGAGLPDHRAYELVTPPDTGVLIPSAQGIATTAFAGGCFDTYPVTADGESMIFSAPGGAIPGFENAGHQAIYRSFRTGSGWETETISPTGAEAPPFADAGCVSADHLFSVYLTSDEPGADAPLSVNGERTFLVRAPSSVVNPACSPDPGTEYEVVGCGGSIDPHAVPRWISSGGSHIVFTSAVQLAAEGPPTGTQGIYDRSPGGPLHVVSLLPGDEPLAEGESAQYSGVSEDGSMVAFQVNGSLYLRKNDAATVKVASVGGTAVGTALTCTGTTGAGITTNLRWLRNGAPIAGASSSTYTTTQEDAGKVIQCQVFALGANTGATQTSTPAVVVDPAPSPPPPVPPFFLEAPAVTGATSSIPVPGPTDGDRTLTCEPQTEFEPWQGSPTFSYQWYKDGAEVPGATGNTLVIAENSLNDPANYQCAVTGTNVGGATTVLSPNRTTEPSPSPEPPFASASTGAAGEPFFGGLTRNNEFLFYEQRGDLFSFDIGAGATTQISTGNRARFVNVSEDGGGAYFVSTVVLTGAQENAAGDVAAPDANNLYGWQRGEGLTFIATLAAADVSGGTSLANWSALAVTPKSSEFGRGTNGSRTLPDGSVFLFESAGDPLHLGGLEGKFQIYRFDAEDQSLVCVSCPADNRDAGSASLQLSNLGNGNKNPVQEALGNDVMHIQNITSDGDTVFFQTTGALVPDDVNGTWDVYEWKKGQQPYLISSGHHPLPSFLYGMSPDGRDVFFRTADRLTADDPSEVYSIYDARSGGGFQQVKPPPPCQVDSCQGAPGAPPSLSVPSSQSVQGSGNVKKSRVHCGKNKRRVKRKGHWVCVKKHKKHHQRSNSKRGAGR